MDLKRCKCPKEDPIVDDIISIRSERKEEIIEIKKHVEHRNGIWQQIIDQFNKERRQIEEYRLYKNVNDCHLNISPAQQFLEDRVFSILSPTILEGVINKAILLDCVKHQKDVFNSIDFISEMLWNLNPMHPERVENWTNIFDMDWVVDWLQNNPRPIYPFSWIWSPEWAATKIQSAIRGHWIRRREDVQEMRQFWKTLKKEHLQSRSEQ